MATPPEIEGPGGGRGKWGLPGVPRSGWVCVEVEDLEEPSQICEMCETMEIRYVHHMEHPDYSDVLGCGCVCAGHMEEDLSSARERERLMKNSARRRANWPNRVGWHLSKKGNPTIKADGFRVTIVPTGRGYSVVLADLQSGQVRRGSIIHPTVEAAQLSAFDRILLGL